MALSIAVIMFFGLISNYFFTKLKLPGLLGMLLVGVIIGPYCLNLLDESILSVSADLRKIALIIILLRAGLGINRSQLKKVGITAFKLSFIPAVFEGLMIAFATIYLFGFDFLQGGMLGFILAAVSPAVVVPLMLKINQNKLGTKKAIPTLVLSGASIDDVVSITIFSSFMGIYVNANFNIGIQLLNIPLSIILGIAIGFIIGYILVLLFNKLHIRDSMKVILIIALAIFLVNLENYIIIASLLGVMSIGFIIAEKKQVLGSRLSSKLSKIWVFAEIFLFVLVGAEVDINIALDAGLIGLLIIGIGLASRSIGVLISTYKSGLLFKEKMFVVVSYLPKATVQAAIGSIPKIAGVANGDLILAIAVLSIIITAPLGAILIDRLAPVLLKKEEDLEITDNILEK